MRVAVAVWLKVAVTVEVRVGENVGVIVAVIVALRVGVNVGVTVALIVGDEVDVRVGVSVGVSVGVDGQNPNGPSMAQRFRPSIDSGCMCVGFSSDASNLVEGDTNRKTDVFLRLFGDEVTLLASHGLGGEPANGASSFTSLPASCENMAFQSNASNLVENDTNNVSDIFVYQLSDMSITRVSVGAICLRISNRRLVGSSSLSETPVTFVDRR